ncbi:MULTISPECIES: enoyl-CoA hydratase/isomerase family protein [Alphaproteobacteria]|uniref:3-hydroxyisobutyryl-CoA hydrolase n=2 Tax=Alphaproteobacteria TaxID=28211 RepID=A0A512HL87_9HYPH|nr:MULTISPECIES: enoyl-CoA hydratase/isomerase family protein [Alphaproteobacteria]GEO86212.1 3-hydroxyisobutyryl-CoA hydrolase [Ciceribacter naphthalenivorans]GLR21410.1 3-hydroxyisobutyryl-CoA hydrolase [Ciceribacter naphthalenivorans]GLT04266.1 3-hydroxyisobutyryl-CoA hydrolase [Sphingomonas psychrolutea]
MRYLTTTELTGEDVLSGRQGSLGVILLNRPRVLNSLSLPMVQAIGEALDRFEKDPAIAAVLMTGEGERGLCAGGDIRTFYESGKAGDGRAADFLRAEYRMNARIATYSKPYVVFMEGITMGGGVGVSSHGSHRIVTDTTKLAMPETGIGFFPDIGATWLLARAPGELGTLMGLTGEAIGAADAIEAGFADRFVPASALATLAESLTTLPANAGPAEVSALVEAAAKPAPVGEFVENRALIDRCFGFDTVEQIAAALAAEESAFATRVRSAMLAKSPTSLKVTLALLRAARRSPDLETCLEREFAATAQILHTPDFYEGIRAAIIDKDRNPRWSPASLDAVGPQIVEPFFKPHPQPLFS